VKRWALLLLAPALVLGPLAATSSGQQRVRQPTDEEMASPEVDMAVVPPDVVPSYVRFVWEVPGLQMPELGEAAVVAVHEDDNQLKFLVGNELGSFRPAPMGGSAFFGQGRAIFGVTAPKILPSRVLRPLGTGDAGDRFLGAPPPISEVTVIPKIGDTFDDRRHSYAFLGGPPAIVDTGPSGSTAFPLPEVVIADPNGPGIPDNIPAAEPPSESPPVTTPPVTLPPASGPPITIAPRPTTTVAPGPPPVIPTTTTTTPATTTTSTTTTTTTIPATTTTTVPTTTTTTTIPTTTTTTVPTTPTPTASFVLGNQRESASFCLSSGSGGTSNNCDRLFDLTGIKPGQSQAVNLTLWNVDPNSNTDAVDLRVFSTACTSGTTGAAPRGSGNLCDGLKLKIERYGTAARTGSPTCIFGCALDKSLTDFRTTHSSMANGAQIDTSFVVNEKAYLKLTVLLTNSGFNTSGKGLDNKYQGRTATLGLTWQMTSA
jgi:hypothetical protein